MTHRPAAAGREGRGQGWAAGSKPSAGGRLLSSPITFSKPAREEAVRAKEAWACSGQTPTFSAAASIPGQAGSGMCGH